jgi:hypothetical protein
MSAVDWPNTPITGALVFSDGLGFSEVHPEGTIVTGSTFEYSHDPESRRAATVVLLAA